MCAKKKKPAAAKPSAPLQEAVAPLQEAVSPPRAASPAKPALVVGVGASAGGLDALSTFFGEMPNDTGMSFVVIQHLDPQRASILPELLEKRTGMPVRAAADGLPLESNHVYVIPPNAVLTLEHGVLRLSPPIDAQGISIRPAHAVDSFFCSLAEDQADRAVCIVLSGAGSDGTVGLKRIKENGGLAMAQTAISAKCDAMPRSAASTGLVDFVLPATEMPAKLLEYLSHLRRLEHDRGPDALRAEVANRLPMICRAVRRRNGHDFSRYKENTIIRRIQRRMQVLHIESADGYVERLQDEPQEADELFKDLLIGVTQFFRDPEAFEALDRLVIPRLIAKASDDRRLRVWIAGCATGEEAYSIAILLCEQIDSSNNDVSAQIFATDIDENALDVARSGRYPESVVESMSEERRRRFFIKHGNLYQITKPIRDMCVFSSHNVIKDPPFSRIDLITCRNLLIYLDPGLQKDLLPVFHYALRPEGFLFLGPSESVSSNPGLFRTVDKKHRLFQRREAATAVPLHFPLLDASRRVRPLQTFVPQIALGGAHRLDRAAERLLLDNYAPAAAIVNDQGQVQYFSARTGKFLQPAVGIPNSDILAMARPGLRPDLRAALHEAIKTGAEVVHRDVVVQTNGDKTRINLVVRPAPELAQEGTLFIVLFQEIEADGEKAPGEAAGAAPGDRPIDPLVHQLETELTATKERLQSSVEDLESANEELKSSNEELLSMNEELQSTNEEIQTAKEEMQSVNEELKTINTELNRKVEDLDRANSDMVNFLRSTQIPTVFLDNDLKIRRFTPAMADIFRLIERDVGRPITDIAARFNETRELQEDIRKVLETLAPREREVQLAEEPTWYTAHVLPYRSLDNVIVGVVLTFTDITQHKQQIAKIDEGRRIAESIVDTISEPLLVLDGNLRVMSANRAFCEMFRVTHSETAGRLLYDLGRRQWDVYQLRELLERTLPADWSLVNYEVEYDFPHIGRRAILLNARRLDGNTTTPMILLAMEDVTERRAWERSLQDADRHKNEFLAMLGHELRNPLAAVLSSLEMLDALTGVDPAIPEICNVLRQQVNMMVRLADDLLDIARISQSRLELQKQIIDLAGVVRHGVELARPLIVDRNHDLRVSLPEAPIRLEADPVRLEQVIANLLVNAAKYTEPGGKIQLVAVARDGEVELRVKDSGMGINAEMLPRIFDLFQQAGRPHLRSSGGLGIGLTMAQTLVRLHGGTIEAHSDGPGQGSEFVVRLPTVPSETPLTPTPTRARRPTVPPMRVLVVEDNHGLATVTSALLKRMGHEARVAPTGGEALAAASAFRPQVVLLDIGLPDMDGYEVARRLRDEGHNGPPPRLVALTGYGPAEVRDRSGAAGFDEYLLKPVSMEVLAGVLERCHREQANGSA